MRFSLVHKVTSYLMVLTSTLALAASGELNPVTSGLALVGLAASWRWEPPRVDLARYERLWNVLTILVLLACAAQVMLGAALIRVGAYFLLFLAANKLFNRRASRDYLQLYVLTLLEMIAATALDSDLTYGLFFALYIVFATWTLILFHLKREMEENYLLKYGEALTARPVQVERVLGSRRVIGPRFLLATSGVSLAVFLGAALMFFAFPRVGFGLFFKKQRGGIAMSGFSDRIELGHFGLIKDDPTVVMRVEFADPGQRRLVAPYWRGISFDHYDGRTWTKSRRERRRPRRWRGGAFQVNDRAPGAPLVEQRIYLEPMDARVLFGLDRIVAVSLEDDDLLPRHPVHRRGLRVDADGDLHYRQRDQLAFRYTVFSQPPAIPAGALETPLEAYRAAVRQAPDAAPYLQVPDDLDPRVSELAARVVGDAATVGEAIDRVERHLRRRYGYTLDLRRDPRFAPLEDFLFVQKRGHCEYFSTAMTILLRTQGIAARNVNGFYGGTWNSYGQYLAVSQGDAHSWVEVLLPGGRWMTREPTPSGAGRSAAAGIWTSVLQWVDALRLRWYKYVIEYDLQRQIASFRRLGAMLRGVFGGGGAGAAGVRTRDPGGLRWRPDAPTIALAVAVVLLIAAIALRRSAGGAPSRRARARASRSAAVAELYRAMDRAYRRLGHERPAAATAREYLATLRERGAPDLDLARRVVDLYEAARFGGAAVPADVLHELARAVRRIGRAR